MISPILSCLIIEDEPLAQEILVDHVNTVPFLSLAGVASNVFEAMNLMDQTNPDLILLDINLPRLNGLDWLRTLERGPVNVIVTTANPTYAIEGYDLNLIDYLLKPIRLERFVKAVNRFRERLTLSPAALTPPARLPEPMALFVKEGKELVRIAYDDIMFIEGMDDYVRIHKDSEVIVTPMRMAKVEELLPSPPFYRLNRSFIVQQECVDRVAGNQVTLCTGTKLVVTRMYQNTFQTMLRHIHKK